MKKPVLLITFNRLEETQKTFEQIAIAKPPRLYLASDGPRPDKECEKEKVEAVRKWLLENINWDCDVKTRFLETNSGGCRYGVSGAIDWFFETEEDGIIMEDDLVASQSFFTFCEELLDYYKDNEDVWVVSGYNSLGICDIKESYYFTNIMDCWGWATWKNKWQNYHKGLDNFDEKIFNRISKDVKVQKYWFDILRQMQTKKIDSWAYQWALLALEKNKKCINPAKNLISNIGYTGAHYDNHYKDPLLGTQTYTIGEIKHHSVVKINPKILNKIHDVYDISKPKLKILAQYIYKHPLFLFKKKFWKMLKI